jgi:hypothetical protein
MIKKMKKNKLKGKLRQQAYFPLLSHSDEKYRKSHTGRTHDYIPSVRAAVRPYFLLSSHSCHDTSFVPGLWAA